MAESLPRAERDPFDAERLFTAAWRRVTLLGALYGTYDATDDERFRRLRTRLREAPPSLRFERPRWVEWERQPDHLVKMRGLLGSVVLEGDLGPLLASLEAATILHLGDGVPYGLGRIRIEQAG
jgi:hypothetical protein